MKSIDCIGGPLSTQRPQWASRSIGKQLLKTVAEVKLFNREVRGLHATQKQMGP